MFRRLLAVCLIASPAPAQTVTWSATAGGSWADPLNWDAGAVPGALNFVQLGGSFAAAGPHLISLDGDREVDGLSTQGMFGPVRVAAGTGGRLRVGASGVQAGGGADLFLDVPLEVTANATLGGAYGRTLELQQLAVAPGFGVNGITLTVGTALDSYAQGTRLRLGAGGIDISQAASGLGLQFTGDNRLVLAASQTWTVGRRDLTLWDNTTPTVDLGAAGQTLTLRGANPGGATAELPVINFRAPLAGAAGLTVTPSGADTSAGAMLVLLSGSSGTTTASGPIVINGGTLAPNSAGRLAWAGTSVTVNGGQLLPGNSEVLPAATVLTLAGSGSYNLGVPNLTTGSMAGVVPRDRGQTFASIDHSGIGSFNTGVAVVNVSGTYIQRALGGSTVNPGGTLTVNRLDLQDPNSPVAGPQPFTVATDFAAFGQVATLTVGSGGLNLQNRSLRLTGTAAAIIGSVVNLDGDVTASGAAAIVGVGPNSHAVRLNSVGASANIGRRFTVAAGGTLTVSAPLTNTGYVPGSSAGTAGLLVKDGPGTMVLAGANQYTGTTTVQAGRLVLGSSDAWPASPGLVTLSGGTLSTAGGPGGAGVSEFGGRFGLTASSTVELGTGPHLLRFSTTALGASPIPAGSLLTVTGWQGLAGESGTAGQLVITDPGGTEWLARVQFDGFPVGAVFVSHPGGGQELVPVPEPASGLLLVAAAGVCVRRRITAG